MKINATYDDGSKETLTPSEVSVTLLNTILNDMQNGRMGEYVYEDGSPVSFEIMVRIVNAGGEA
jgi:hypothetical protein